VLLDQRALMLYETPTCKRGLDSAYSTGCEPRKVATGPLIVPAFFHGLCAEHARELGCADHFCARLRRDQIRLGMLEYEAQAL
jgi:hypothetical protein